MMAKTTNGAQNDATAQPLDVYKRQALPTTRRWPLPATPSIASTTTPVPLPAIRPVRWQTRPIRPSPLPMR